MKHLLFSLCILTTVSTAIISCDKEEKGTTLHVRLTDNPVDAEEVNVDIEEIRVKYRDESDSTRGWTTLDTHEGIYDLLGLQNGVDTLIASGNIPNSTVKEIRFVLGSENTIKVNGQVYPLTIPSGSESGLKIKVNKNLAAGLDSLLIDFDAALSIHQTGNGEYHLKPVLKVK